MKTPKLLIIMLARSSNILLRQIVHINLNDIYNK
jgi:hypothetical protein